MRFRGATAGMVVACMLGWAAPAQAQVSVEWVTPARSSPAPRVSGLLKESPRGSRHDCRVRVTGIAEPLRVKFYVDGRLLNEEIDSPYTCI